MPTRTHYSPCIERALVCALYHEGRRLRRPMTRLVNELLSTCLRDTPGWRLANEQMGTVQGPVPKAGAPR